MTKPLILGRYVTLRRRRDGRVRAYFQVPAHVRPVGWPSAIRLPADGPISGDLADPSFVAWVRGDAASLNAKLVRVRADARVR